MRRIFVVLLFAWATSASAGMTSAVLGGGGVVKAANGTWSATGAATIKSGTAFSAPASITAAGRSVTMPGTASLAANAASFAVSAVRLNPAGLVTSLVASWLLNEGLQYIGGAWKKNTTGSGAQYCADFGTGKGYQCGSTMAQFITKECAGGGGSGTLVRFNSTNYFSSPWGSPETSWTGNVDVYCEGGPVRSVAGTCAAGGTFPSCTPITSQVAAVESDFTVAGTHALPIDAAVQLSHDGVLVPVDAPVLSSAPQVLDYGSPYLDPATNKTVQTKVRVVAEPTAADPYAVRVESYNIDIAAAPAPLPGDPVLSPESEQPKDECLENPDRIGCLNAGSPEDVNLDTWNVPFSVTPVSLGSAGACPPDPVLAVHGATLTLKLAPICDAAAWLKPLVLALAWLTAAMIIGGAIRE